MTATNPIEPTEPDNEPVDLTKPVTEPSTAWASPGPAATPTPPPPVNGAVPPTEPTSQYAPQYNRAPQPPFEGFAIASLILSASFFVGFWFIGSILGIIFGHIALHNIKRQHKRGYGVALAGTIAGYITLGLSVLLTLLLIVVTIVGVRESNQSHAQVQTAVRDEVATIATLESSGDLVAIIDEAGTHRNEDGTVVRVVFDNDYTDFTVTGRDTDNPDYTYTYDSTTNKYTSDEDTDFNYRYRYDSNDGGGDSGTTTDVRYPQAGLNV